MTDRLRVAASGALFLLFCGTAAAQSAVAPSSAPFAKEIQAARAMILHDLEEQDYPGIAIAVSVDGETVWSEGFGYADLEQRVPLWPTSRFRIGSISKPFTAAAVARLFEDGRLDVNAPVQQYVPYFPEKRWLLTTRNLGAHLGGVRHYQGDEFLSSTSYETVESGLAIFAADTLLHAPGQRFAYTSYGWNLISAVVEGASGRQFLHVMRQEVFRPLGMRHTVADHPDSLIYQRVRFYERGANGDLLNAPYVDNSYKWAGGGFLSSPEDLLRFGNAHLGTDFLSEDALALLFTEQQTTAGEGVGYGFGWRVRTGDDSRRYLSHGGGSVGGTSLLIMQPDTKVILAAMINLSGADLEVAHDVLRLFVESASGN